MFTMHVLFSKWSKVTYAISVTKLFLAIFHIIGLSHVQLINSAKNEDELSRLFQDNNELYCEVFQRCGI